jgi:hypothetical protein
MVKWELSAYETRFLALVHFVRPGNPYFAFVGLTSRKGREYVQQYSAGPRSFGIPAHDLQPGLVRGI